MDHVADISTFHIGKSYFIPGLDGRESILEKQALLQSLEKNGDIFDVNVMAYWGAMLILIGIVLLGVIFIQKRKDST